jgi:hypothetical protein
MGISAMAQMMPDSTVQFVAYWDVGDKQAYNVSTSEYKVSESDTTEVEYSTEIRMFEVLAKTDSTYKLAVTYKDVHSSDPQMNLLYQIMTETSGDMKVILTTDQHGSIKSIDNLEELVSHQMKVVEPFMEMLGNEEGAELDEQTEAALKDYIVQTFSDPSIIEKSVYDEVGRMLYFHGNRLDMEKEYSGEIDAESIIPGIEAPIKAQTRVWIDTDYTVYEGPDAAQQPAGRVGNPMDIVNMVMFLCSDKAGFITGENICIDGGMTKLMIYHGDHGWTMQ